MRRITILLLLGGILGVLICTLPKRKMAAVLPPSPTNSMLPAIILKPTATPILAWMTGDMRNQIEYLEDNAPRANSEGYRAPTAAEMEAFSHLANQVLAEELLSARDMAVANQYELISYQDEGDGQAISYLLREIQSGQKGWGLYAVRQNSTSPFVIEAPHTLADERTPAIALAVYRTLAARALLVAGAHREANQNGSADVAHSPQSIFQAVHIVWSEEAVVLQIHGFAADNHPNYPQVVLGSDQAQPTALMADLAQALTEEGVEVGVCDGQQWRDLCGTQNVQSGAVATAVFIHVELDESIRSNLQPFLTALGQLTNVVSTSRQQPAKDEFCTASLVPR